MEWFVPLYIFIIVEYVRWNLLKFLKLKISFCGYSLFLMKQIFNTIFYMKNKWQSVWYLLKLFLRCHLTPQSLFCSIISTTTKDIQCERKNRSDFHGVRNSMNSPIFIVQQILSRAKEPRTESALQPAMEVGWAFHLSWENLARVDRCIGIW